jgi:uncharacterized protein YgiM (DUF1202 family)
MRKFRLLLTYVPIILMVGTFCLSQGFAAEHFPSVGEISRGPVNVRAGANTNFEAVDKLSAGTEVVVLGHSYEWYKIQLPLTAAAYLRADYIKEAGDGVGEMVGDKVNIRAKPSSDASMVGQMRKGELVKLLEKTNDWWKIEAPAGAYGWVHQDFLKLKSSEVPASLARKPLTVPAAAVPAKQTPSQVAVTVQGRVEPVVGADAHYQIVVDGNPAYYLQDVPHLDRFNRALVRVEGTVTPAAKGAAHPVLHVKTISLVL